MQKQELLNRLNDIIEEKQFETERTVFEMMTDRNNTLKHIDVYINIETGAIFAEIYNGCEPITPNEYVIKIAEDMCYDISLVIYEGMDKELEEYYTKEIGIYSEYLEAVKNNVDFVEFLESLDKVEEFEDAVIDQICNNFEFEVRKLEMEDIADLDTDDIVL